MKKLLIFCFLMIASFGTLLAQVGKSTVKVRLADNSVMKIAIDKHNYSQQGNTITIDDLAPGRHRLKVFIPSQKHGRKSLVYDGYFKIDPNTSNYIVVDRFKKAVRITSESLTHYPTDPIDRSRYPRRTPPQRK
ncbi:MAG TPA: hypothetical protein VL093_05030 [Flavipsychrobacter sp.]|nr:hypothetical protein [Flavipsychrobacter sp.]